MRDSLINNLFFNFTNTPLNIDHIPTESYEDILSHSFKNNFAATLLNIIQYDKENNALIKGLKKQRKDLLFKCLVNRNSSEYLAKLLDKEGIANVMLKGIALNWDGFYEVGSRPSKDIDVLVKRKDIEQAYAILKTNGFFYRNKLVSDKATHIEYSHHLPVMEDGKGTFIELHHRATAKREYETCPITPLIFSSARKSHKSSFILVPNDTMKYIHALYHGYKQSNLNLGPLFLHDLFKLYQSPEIDHYEVERLTNSLKLSNQHSEIKEILKSGILPSQKFFQRVQKTYNYNEVKNDTLKTITNKVKAKSFTLIDKYQVKKYSVKFFIVFFHDAFVSLLRRIGLFKWKK